MNAKRLLAESIASIPKDLEKKLEISYSISDKLYNEMQKQGITQRELANRMNKRPSEISKWLRGTHNFTINTLVDISFAIGVDLIKICE